MKKTIIPILMLLASCTSDPSTIGLETRSEVEEEPAVTLNLESDSLVNDPDTIILNAKEWEEVDDSVSL